MKSVLYVLGIALLAVVGTLSFTKLSGEGKEDMERTNELTVKKYNGDKITYTDQDLKELLSPIQYKVTQKDGTEQAFENEYWDNKEEGIYVDLLSGEPLFSSENKYKSGTGWPSFTKPLVEENIVTKKDPGIFGMRTEVRSKEGDAHLGHVFKDGPEPTGLRYCMNSAALEFIPKGEMEARGYGAFLDEFKS